MREMVLRERAERVAHVRAIAAIVARVVNADVDRAFGDVVADYASEVFQETYDPAALARKAAQLREAQAVIRRRQAKDAEMLVRLQRMETLGQEYDKTRGREFDRQVPTPSNFKSLKK